MVETENAPEGLIDEGKRSEVFLQLLLELAELEKEIEGRLARIRRRILTEAGLLKIAPAPTEFVDFRGRKHIIKYRKL